MSITIKVADEEALRALDSFSKDIEKEILLELEKEFKLVVDKAKRVHRFTTRTGRLERATLTDVQGKTVRALIDDALAPYGKYIHEGFKTWSSDPYLEEKFDQDESKIIVELEKAIDRVITRLGLD